MWGNLILAFVPVILILRKARVSTDYPIVMIRLGTGLLFEEILVLVHQVLTLLNRFKSSTKVKNRGNSNLFGSRFNVFENTFENIGTALIQSKIRPKRCIHDVREKTIAFYEAHNKN